MNEKNNILRLISSIKVIIYVKNKTTLYFITISYI